MKKLNFTKMDGAGNDFIILDARADSGTLGIKNFSSLARKLCARKTGIGADGVLVLEKSKIAGFRMRIFNADGSIAEMCGNGLRCAILYAGAAGQEKIKVETMAGVHEGEIIGKDRVRVKMQEPSGLRLDFPISVHGRKIKANFINTGVPHAVVFVEGLDKIDAGKIGSEIRYHDEFKPKGANADFVEIIDNNNINIRTYERGVEGETLACGTGAVASAIIACHVLRTMCHAINVHTRGGILKVGFRRMGNKIKDVYLEGGARIVFQGGIYV